jgi:hypothetical protein
MQESLVPGDEESGNVSGWNRQVRLLAGTLPDGADHPYGFACSCGCGEIVPLTSTQFDANGAWVDGHKPE